MCWDWSSEDDTALGLKQERPPVGRLRPLISRLKSSSESDPLAQTEVAWQRVKWFYLAGLITRGREGPLVDASGQRHAPFLEMQDVEMKGQAWRDS